MCSKWVPKLWMLSEKVRIFYKKVTKIRVSKIRVNKIRLSEIRISSSHRELHGAIFFRDMLHYRLSAKHYRHPLPKVFVQHFLYENGTHCIHIWSVYLCRIKLPEGICSEYSHLKLALFVFSLVCCCWPNTIWHQVQISWVCSSYCFSIQSAFGVVWNTTCQVQVPHRKGICDKMRCDTENDCLPYFQGILCPQEFISLFCHSPPTNHKPQWFKTNATESEWLRQMPDLIASCAWTVHPSMNSISWWFISHRVWLADKFETPKKKLAKLWCVNICGVWALVVW